MKKVLIISSIVMVFLGTLYGCGTGQEPITTWKKCGYVKREGDIDFAVYYDVNTKVMYSSGAYGKTVLLNSDGTPMLWEGGLKCSLCGRNIHFHENYCPECGAKMDRQ